MAPIASLGLILKSKPSDWPRTSSTIASSISEESGDLSDKLNILGKYFPRSISSLSPSDTDGDQYNAPALSEISNAVRILSVDAIENAGSGHPGMVLGMAPTATVLWERHINFNPCHPDWINRDRFVLSAGHGSMLQYSLMYLFGFDSITLHDIKTFRKLGSRAAGHPENTITNGVEVMTGALGQGISNAVGIALAESHLAATYNRSDAPAVIDHFTYCIVGDGCLMEGVSSEVCSLAGHWKLGKLIVFYDDNSISIEGSTDLAFTEDVARRFHAYGWQVLEIADGNTDVNGIDNAIVKAKNCVDKPSLIKVTTTIGYGAPTKAGSEAVHGSCLGADEVAGLRKSLGWPHKAFDIPESILSHTRSKRKSGVALERNWQLQFEQYRLLHPNMATQFEALVIRRELPSDWRRVISELSEPTTDGRFTSTRALSGIALNAVAKVLPNLLGGSADLGPSNLSRINCSGDYQWNSRGGRNLHFGVREHGMGSIANGIALYGGGLIPFVATFFVFTDYMRAAIRTAALARAGVIFILTHDSILLGEDGPTHQPIEHLASFRAMPNVFTMRPAGAAEVAACYGIAVQRRNEPSLLVLSRQKFKCASGSAAGPWRGGYVFSDVSAPGDIPDILLIASGSEVPIAEDAAKTMRGKGHSIRVVSMPCMELFQMQSKAYRRKTLNVAREKRIVVEAGARFGWDRYASHFCTVDRFGASGGQVEVADLFKLTASDVVARAQAVLTGSYGEDE